MTDHTHTTIRLMTIAEGLESLRSYHDHIPVMLELQKEVMPIEQYRELWNKLRYERRIVKDKIRDLLWQFYATMKEERQKSKRDEFHVGC